MIHSAVLFCTISILLTSSQLLFGRSPERKVIIDPGRGQTIEDFDDGSVVLQSYPGEDLQPGAWNLEPRITYGGSPYSLRIYGNTWKLEPIPGMTLDSTDIWQVAAYIENLGEIHGFGLCDSLHTLFYAFGGTEMLDIDQWVTVYQGAFPPDTWNLYLLPVSEDWRAFFGYLPTITGLVFVNDRDSTTSGSAYFDAIVDVTEDQPMAPQVRIQHTIGNVFEDRNGARHVTVQFQSVIEDTDSYYHNYCWSFGDDSTSNAAHPSHTYVIDDDHQYTVLLEVRDSTDLWGRASCEITLDPGPTTFPIRINFTGDIMLARRYENPGGIIDTAGVEAIFAPTRAILGDAADITVANLESPLTDQGTPHPTKPILIRGRPANVAGLAYAGIDVVSLANNHVIDYGLAGIRQTQDSLRANRILYSGAGADAYEAFQPVFRLKHGVNIAFLSACNRTGQDENTQPFFGAGYNKPGFAELSAFQIGRQVRAVRPNADLVVVETHSGNEYCPVPPLGPGTEETNGESGPIGGPVPDFDDIAIRRAAIDAGADLVVNHHPHQLQGFEVYQGKLIAHSLGNFAFDQNYFETFPSAILNARINAAGFYDYSVYPVFIDHYIPRPALGELGRHILDYLSRRSRDLGTYVITDRDRVTARIVLDTLSLMPVEISIDTALVLAETSGSGYWLSSPARLARIGSISRVQALQPAGSWQYRLGRELVWFGNFEDEGSAMWRIDQADEFYDTVHYHGDRSLCQVRAQAGSQITTGLENRLPILCDSTRYTLYGHLRTDNARNAGVTIRWYASRVSNNPLGQSDLGMLLNGTNDWGFYFKEFSPVSDSLFFDLSLSSQGPLFGGTGRAWFDNTGIIEWEDWQSWSGPCDVAAPNDYYWLQVRRNTADTSVSIRYAERVYGITTVEETKTRKGISSMLFIRPNPCRTRCVIEYYPGSSGQVKIMIYNILGQTVKTLVEQSRSNGHATAIWEGLDDAGRAMSAGVYFCRIQANGQEQTKKIILLK